MATITLITDTGSNDGISALLQSHLVRANPFSNIIIVSQEVKPYSVEEAAYLADCACVFFPPGTLHLVLVDLFYAREPELLVAEKNGQYLIFPANGLLQLSAFAEAKEMRVCRKFAVEDGILEWADGVANAVAQLVDAGDSIDGWRKLERTAIAAAPIHSSAKDILECSVVHVDRFGNVAINFRKEDHEQRFVSRPFEITFRENERIRKLSKNYRDVREGDKLARFNSAGYLEICIHHGHAGNLLGLKLGSNNNQIKIEFL